MYAEDKWYVKTIRYTVWIGVILLCLFYLYTGGLIISNVGKRLIAFNAIEEALINIAENKKSSMILVGIARMFGGSFLAFYMGCICQLGIDFSCSLCNLAIIKKKEFSNRE